MYDDGDQILKSNRQEKRKDGTFGAVSLEVLRHLPFGTQVFSAVAWACIGGSAVLLLHALAVFHKGGSQLLGAALVWTALFLLGTGARFWNSAVMPKVFHYLWAKAAEKGLADRYAANIRLQYGDSMNHVARVRGFVQIVSGYCAACRSSH
ncbi:hypothetical protein [Ralstonia pseudosolanacearum]|uniref:hypothetical protein n=1 Tax=Ralstonia pseudosolanacearum TaxID=1310165 RepID=UPI003CF5395B